MKFQSKFEFIKNILLSITNKKLLKCGYLEKIKLIK